MIKATYPNQTIDTAGINVRRSCTANDVHSPLIHQSRLKGDKDTVGEKNKNQSRRTNIYLLTRTTSIGVEATALPILATKLDLKKYNIIQTYLKLINLFPLSSA